MNMGDVAVFSDQAENLRSMSLMFTLNQLLVNFIYYFPLISLILGFVGFIGNLLTYLQPELRTNTCCIYSLCGSVVDIIHLFINALPDYLSAKHGIHIPWERSSLSCRILFFQFVYLPNLSLNFLVMSMIDRYACTCDLTWRIHRLNRLKVIPWTISSTIVISCLDIDLRSYYGLSDMDWNLLIH